MQMTGKYSSIRLIGISGSLRRDSYCTAILRTLRDQLPEQVTLDIFELTRIPLYNQNDEAENFPSSVQTFKDAVARCDGVVIASPEYNYGMPGVLKNALDWASRPIGDSAWSGKPAAIMGASHGAIGTARAQYHLRQILVALNLFTLNQPEVVIADAARRFDENGNLIHEPTKQLIRALLKNLLDWTRRISPALAREASP